MHFKLCNVFYIVNCAVFENLTRIMPKSKELSIETRAVIVAHHETGKSNGEISRLMKISRRKIDYNVKKFKESASLKNKPRTGRPRITTFAEDSKLIVTSKRNRRLTAPELAAEANLLRDKRVSVTTVQRRLREVGLYGRIAARKPFLRAENKKKRLEWARKHKNLTLDQWKNVLWSDESKFEVFGSKRRVFIRRSVGERMSEQCLLLSVKHGGGSVMVWGCFGGDQVGNIHKVEGIMRK